MAALTGLFMRGSSYYLRVVLPLDHPLRARYKTGHVVTSLGPVTRRQATVLGTIKRAQILTGMPLPVAPARLERAGTRSDGPAPVRLREVFNRWQVSRPRSQDAIAACLRAVKLYEQHTGDQPITALTRDMGDAFRAWLQHPERKTTPKTARDRLTWVKSLLKFATRDLELITRNPWEGLDIVARVTKQRRPWTQAELETLFGQPLHQNYILPTDTKAGAAAAYWIPLIGIFSGARISELAQLRVIDVNAAAEIPCISITDQGEAQTVKSKAGVRQVPVHRELVRLGLLDYVEERSRAGDTQLWPNLPVREGKPGGFFSQWFGEYRKSLGLGPLPDFHCIRHSVRTALADARVQEPVIDALLGHEVGGSTGARVYTHRSLRTLQVALDSIAYPKLTLPRCFADRPSCAALQSIAHR